MLLNAAFKSIFCGNFLSKLLILSLSLLAFRGQAQSIPTVILPAREMTLKELFSEIENQTGYTFAYSNANLNIRKKLSLPAINLPLDQTLDKVFSSGDYGYVIVGSHIIVSVKKQKKDEPKISPPVVEKPARKPKPVPPVVFDEPVPERPPDPPVLRDTLNTLPFTSDPTKEYHMNDITEYPTVKTRPYVNSRYPRTVVKFNVLKLAAITPNLGFEFRIAEHLTGNIEGAFSPWKFGNDRKFVYYTIQPEMRYWYRESFNRFFTGVYFEYTDYDIQKIKLIRKAKNKGYNGSLYGFGVSGGYRHDFNWRWSIEFTGGIGWAHAQYREKIPGLYELYWTESERMSKNIVRVRLGVNLEIRLN